MVAETFCFTASDGVELFARKWIPETGDRLRAVVQLAHGMAEHSARYERFAEALCQSNIGVYANDHRGHGKTAGSSDKIGFFAEANGWQRVVDDMEQLTAIIADQHSHIPIFLLGHSMGSFLSRTYMARKGGQIKGVILSGTGGDPGLLGKIGRLIARMERWFRGQTAPSPLLNHLSFGGFNKAFKPNRTDFDWLSRDESEVDKYIADPFCGGVFTTGFFCDLLEGIDFINRPEAVSELPESLPILLFSGQLDPVGNNGSGVDEVYRSYQKAGITDLQIKLYDGGRHEMLNETNREEVTRDVIHWIEARA